MRRFSRQETPFVKGPNLTLKKIVVPLESADPGCGKFIPVDADHLHVCKHGSRDEYAYTMTLDFLKEVIVSRKREKALESAMVAIEQSQGLQLADVGDKGKKKEEVKADDPELPGQETPVVFANELKEGLLKAEVVAKTRQTRVDKVIGDREDDRSVPVEEPTELTELMLSCCR